MKVDHIASVAPTGNNQGPQRVKPTQESPACERDSLELCQGAEQFEEFLKAAQNVPDVRTDRVESIKRQIESGEYKVDSNATADKILEQLGF